MAIDQIVIATFERMSVLRSAASIDQINELHKTQRISIAGRIDKKKMHYPSNGESQAQTARAGNSCPKQQIRAEATSESIRTVVHKRIKGNHITTNACSIYIRLVTINSFKLRLANLRRRPQTEVLFP